MEPNIEEVGEIADVLDNLIHAMALPLKAEHHLGALKATLPGVRDRLRAAYIAMGGENHWEGRP